MDIGGLKRKEFKVWMPFLDTMVLICYVPADRMEELTDEATEVIDDGKRRRVTLNTTKHNQLLGRAAVRDWKGFTDGEEDFPYSPENCDLLMAKWTEFIRFVGNACVNLQSMVMAEKETQAKNCVLTSGQE